jgi:hypothetical protein
METLSQLGAILGGSWASGVNLYLTVAILGVINRIGWVQLPGQLDTLSHPIVIGSAIVLYLIEFVADKIPFVDNAWDVVHTVIRPVGGAVLGYMALSQTSPALATAAGLLTGTIALDSHLTKATTRVAINSTPVPFLNSVASVTEDTLVIGIFWLVLRHPIISAVLVVLFILFSIWFLKTMFRFLKKLFGFLFASPAKS